MKKVFWILLPVLIVIVCVLTCPDRQKHETAIKETVRDVMNESSEDEEPSGLAALGSAIGSGLAGLAMDMMFDVNNYGVCSIGHISWQGEDKVVSVGIMNHVFVVAKGELREALGKE